jgi:hypothetical protein
MIRAAFRLQPLRGFGLIANYAIGTRKEFTELFSAKKYR